MTASYGIFKNLLSKMFSLAFFVTVHSLYIYDNNSVPPSHAVSQDHAVFTTA